MRLDGVGGADKRFADLRITRINLGDAKKTQSIRDAASDAFGNKLMKQAGATFVVAGKTRAYADLWFNIQARVKPAQTTPQAQLKAQMQSMLMSGMSRRV